MELIQNQKNLDYLAVSLGFHKIFFFKSKSIYILWNSFRWRKSMGLNGELIRFFNRIRWRYWTPYQMMNKCMKELKFLIKKT